MKAGVRSIILISLLIAMGGEVSLAATIRVPADRSTIQSAVNIAGNSDTILVSDGQYREHVVMRDKRLTLTSANGAAVTLLASDSSRVMTLIACDSLEIRGFTLTGVSSGNGGAVYIDSSVVIMSGMVITGSSSTSDVGGGIYAANTRLMLKGCSITGNSVSHTVTANGGGIYCETCQLNIDSCTISGNSAVSYYWPAISVGTASSGGGIYFEYGDSLLIRRSTISDNSCHEGDGNGGGVYAWGGTILIERSAIEGNSITANYKYCMGARGGGMYLNAGDISVDSCQIKGNRIQTTGYVDMFVSSQGGGLYASGMYVFVANCNIASNLASADAPISMWTCGTASIAEGGGCWVEATNGTFLSNTIDGNAATAFTENEGCSGTSATARGGGCFLDGISGWNNSVIGNDASAFLKNTYTGEGGYVSRADGGGCYYAGLASWHHNLVCFNRVEAAHDDIPDTTNTCNDVTSGAGVQMAGTSATCNLFYGNIGGADWSGNPGSDGIHADPLLCNSAEGDFTIAAGSQCLPGNNDCSAQIGRYGQVCIRPAVVSIEPGRDALEVSSDASITATFDTDMDAGTINDSTVAVTSQYGGRVDGTIGYVAAAHSLNFTPSHEFLPGEVISVGISSTVTSAAGATLGRGYSWTFHVATEGGSANYVLLDNLATNGLPNSVLATDVNGDGFPDLIATSPNGTNEPGSICVRLNNHDGTFDPLMNYTVGHFPYVVRAGDLDGDGDLDLISANWHSDDISILLNLGNGTFDFSTSYPSGVSTSSVCAADFNGDAIVDVVSSNNGDSSITLFFGDGSGEVDPIMRYRVGVQPYDLCAADLDSDGDQDIAVANRIGNSVSVLLNEGHGTFAPHVSYSVWGRPHSIVAVDIEDDGDLDLATANYDKNAVYVLGNYGNGTFYGVRDIAVGVGPHGLFTGDFDGDGDFDLATANDGSSNVSILRNTGSGVFGPQAIFPVGGSPACVTGGDLDADGDVDLVTANGMSTSTLSVLVNQNPPQVVTTDPASNERNVPTSQGSAAYFDQGMTGGDFDSSTFLMYGSISGPAGGVISYSVPNLKAQFNLVDYRYAGGERVTAVLTGSVRSATGIPMGQGYTWTYTVDAAASEGTFADSADFPAGDSVISVIAADVDRDGDPELVTANWGANDVRVLENSGRGVFSPSGTYPVGGNPYVVRAADLDGDGYLDLVTADELSGTVSELLNDGAGSFTPRVGISVPGGPLDVCPVDIDADGDIDLVTGHHNVDSLAILLNNGNGTFLPYRAVSAGARAYSVVAADLDRDGDMDIATANRESGNVSVLFNDGNGGLVLDSQYTADPGTLVICAADFNGDGHADLATANWQANDISVLINKGDGTFAVPVMCAVGAKPYYLCPVDVDGDDDVDLAVANYGSHTVSVLKNTGSGVFQPHDDYPSGKSPHAICAADLDGDFDLDLVTANNWSRNVTVMLNGVPFGIAETVPERNELNVAPATPIEVTFTGAASLNTITDRTFTVNASSTGRHGGTRAFNDPSKTLVYTDSSDFAAGEVVTLAATEGILTPDSVPLSRAQAWSFTIKTVVGPGTFADAMTEPVGNTPRSVYSADLNGDGLLDIISADAGSDSMSVMFNDGDTIFQTDRTYATGDGPFAVTAGDLNGDGITDLAVANYLASSVSILIGVGDSSFLARRDYGVGIHPYALAIGDLDADGDLDLAVAHEGTDSTWILINSGDGTFPSWRAYYAIKGNRAICATDLDNDGDLDLAEANAYENYVTVLWNDGVAEFSNRNQYVVGQFVESVCAADLDDDGKVDLAAAVKDSNAVIILWNNLGGNFTQSSAMATGLYPRSVVAADVDGDGDLDLATANWSAYSVSILRNNGSRTFSGHKDYAVGAEPHSIFAADIDRDGDVDLMTANRSGNSVSILRNRDAISMDSLPNPPSIAKGDSCLLRTIVRGEPDSVMLYYRLGGDTAWVDTLLHSTDSVYQCKIATDPSGLRSTAYYFAAVQGIDTLTLPAADPTRYPDYVRIAFVDEPVPNVIGNVYQIIGFPFDVDPADPDSVFKDDLGGYNIENWRLGWWDPDRKPDSGYIEYNDIDSIKRGEGYWLYTRRVTAIDGSGSSPVPDIAIGDTAYAAYTLKPGWNQIASPFGFPVRWGHRIANTGIDRMIHICLGTDDEGHAVYLAADTADSFSLQPFCGYFVENTAPVSKMLYLPYVRADLMPIPARKEVAPRPDYWQARLSLESPGVADIASVIGVRPDATDGRDEYDFSKPPRPPGRYLSLGLEQIGANGQGVLLAGDFRGPGVGWIFDLLICGNSGQPATIRIADASLLPPEFTVALKDTVSGRVYRIPRDGRIVLPHVPTPEGVCYHLLVGDTAFVFQGGAAVSMPERFYVHQNHPNPFNLVTTIRYDVPVPCRVRCDIYNILGQRVITLIDQEMPAGPQEAIWDGRDDNGTSVASGIYIYAVTAGGDSAVRKMVLIK